MKNRNCPNCGAPYNIELNKCPYCETSYFDMSSLNFDDSEPFYLKIKINNMYITQLVKPKLGDISIEVDSYNCTGGKNEEILSNFITNKTCLTKIIFEAIPQLNKKELITINMEE